MSCSCSQEKNIKPDQFCNFCVNKHIVAAVSLLETSKSSDDIINLRAAAQLNLALFHMNDNKFLHQQQIIACNKIIKNLLKGEQCFNEIKTLAKNYWNFLNNGIFNPIEDPNFKEIDPNSIFLAVLKIASAIELIKYELSYENVNFSFAIGQLVLATWILQKYDKKLAIECRTYYNDIENKNLKISKLEIFRNTLWNSIMVKRENI